MPFMIHKFRAHFEGSCEELASLLQGIRIRLSTVSSPHFSTFSLQINLSSSTSRLVPSPTCSRKGCASVSHPHLAVWAQPARPPGVPTVPNPSWWDASAPPSMLQLFPKGSPITHSLSARCFQFRRLLPTLRDFLPCFRKMKVEKKKQVLFSSFPPPGSPNPFPILSPSPSNFCPISPPRSFCLFSAIPPPSLSPSRLPLSPLVLPFPPGGGWPQSFHGDGGGGCRKNTKTMGGGERGEGEGAAGTWLKEPCGLGGHRAPTTFCFNSCFWPRAPFFLREH